MRATELLRNKFGISQLYKHEVKDGDEVVLEVYWHPLTIAERESIQKKSDKDCLLYTSPSPRDRTRSRMPSSA